MTAAVTLDECRAFLQRPDNLGNTVHDHLAQTLLKLCEDRPANPVEVFEEVSSAVKQTKFMQDRAPLRYVHQTHPSVDWSKQCVDRLMVRGPGQEGARSFEGCSVQNLTKEAELMEAAGIGIRPYEATRITVMLQQLASLHPIKSLRLWGKITGTRSDYLIAEAKFKDGTTGGEPGRSEAEAAVEPEPYGEGANSFVYFVSTNGDGNWTQLPHARPECIMAARQICKLFTGDLESAVYSYPPFPGDEADYLRATIARIAHGATMTVDGLYSIEEHEETGAQIVQIKDRNFAIQKSEPPFEPVSTGDEGLTQPDEWVTKWVHHPEYPSLLSKMGRCFWPKPPPVPEGEDEPEEDENKEEGIALATNLAEESPLHPQENTPAWSVRLATPMLQNMSPAVLRSLRWPGMHCIAMGDTVVNIYMGSGQKFLPDSFQLALPPVIPTECSELLPGEDGSDEPGPTRPGMKEMLDEPLPNSFNVVDQTAEDGAEEQDE